MDRVRFSVQTTIVVACIFLVSYPQFRPVRAASVWRVPQDAQNQTTTTDSPITYTDTARSAVTGRGRLTDSTMSIEDQRAANRASRTAEDGLPRNFVTPPDVAAEGARVNVLIGRARTSLNTPIPYAKVLLRNIRTGQIEARATANEEGRFQFQDLNSSAYIVELLGPDGSVVAASEMVPLSSGDRREATVRVAVSSAAVAASFNSSLNTTLPQATTNAVNNDITRTTGPADLPAVSPRR